MDYPNDNPLHAARMRVAHARDKMDDAARIAKWRLSPAMLRADIASKRKHVVAKITAKPTELARENPVATVGVIALIGLWLFRKPLMRAMPDIVQGLHEGSNAILDRISGQDPSRPEQE